MQSSFKENSGGVSVESISRPQISSDLLLSLATVPVIFGVFAFRALGELIPVIGEYSEEIFRGDRLPMLNFPQTESDI